MTAYNSVKEHIEKHINKENKTIAFDEINKEINYEKYENIDRLLDYLK